MKFRTPSYCSATAPPRPTSARRVDPSAAAARPSACTGGSETNFLRAIVCVACCCAVFKAVICSREAVVGLREAPTSCAILDATIWVIRATEPAWLSPRGASRLVGGLHFSTGWMRSRWFLATLRFLKICWGVLSSGQGYPSCWSWPCWCSFLCWSEASCCAESQAWEGCPWDVEAPTPGAWAPLP